MTQNYVEYKITKVEKNGNLASLITVKHKEEVFPGQFFIAWIPGLGDLVLPTASYNNGDLEFMIPKLKSDVSKKIHSLKKRSVLMLRGPYGKRINLKEIKSKEIVLIGQTPLFSVLWFIIQKMKSEYTFKKINVFVLQTKPKRAFIDRIKKVNHKIINSFDEALKHIKKLGLQKNTQLFFSVDLNLLKESAELVKNSNFLLKNAYFYLQRKINCGKGLCGTCAVLGFHTCIDGPFFTLEQLKRLIK